MFTLKNLCFNNKAPERILSGQNCLSTLAKFQLSNWIGCSPTFDQQKRSQEMERMHSFTCHTRRVVNSTVMNTEDFLSPNRERHMLIVGLLLSRMDARLMINLRLASIVTLRPERHIYKILTPQDMENLSPLTETGKHCSKSRKEG